MDKRRSRVTRRAIPVEQHELVEAAQAYDVVDVMKQFIRVKRSERSAERTIRNYEQHFQYLLQWLEQNHPDIKLHQITPDVLRDYISWMSFDHERYDGHFNRYKPGLRGLSPTTVNTRIRTMKAFFNWCEREGYVRKSPARDIKLQKVDTEGIEAFSDSQIKRLLSVPDQTTFVGFRDYVIMVTLLDTGLRISELLNVTVNDIDFEAMEIVIPWTNAKTRKTRRVPISPKVGKLLMELIKENEDFGPDAKYLFYSGVGDNRLNPSSFDDRLKQYAKQCGLDDENVRVSAHTFRHTFALHWIKNGGDPFSLQRILGHTDLTMVRRYVKLSQSDIADKHKKYSPTRSLFK